MKDNNQTEQYYAQQTNNYADESVIRTRIVPERILRNVELFLSSKRSILIEQDGKLIEDVQTFGRPLCNQEGVNEILNILAMMINEHTVQGNFKEDDFRNFVAQTRKEITKSIIINTPDWQIPDRSLETIVDSIMRLVKPFFSRTIDNLERESLKAGTQTREIVTSGQNRNAMQKFAGGLS